MERTDWCIIAGYFALLVGIVYWSSRKQKSSTDYFLAGRSIGWFAVGASLFASNIGSEHVVGLAGNGATTGMAMAHWELHAWVMLLLGWVFVPFYYHAKVFTMPEFLEKRFNSKTRWILSIVSLVAYVFTKVSVTVYAGALVFRTLLPDTFGSPDNAFWIGAITTVLLSGLYTILGGLRAVVYTEVAQTGLLLLGSCFITFIGLSELGGWGELQEVCRANKEQFALWRPLSDPDFPWLGVIIASPVIGIWYWCTDQYIVQRTLAAKNLAHARRGTIWGAFLKVMPIFIFLIPGLIGYALHQKGMLTIPLRDGGSMEGDMVFPTLVTTLLPVGLRGIVVAGLLSALMSSLSSLFNSCATLFTVDIYKKLDPHATEESLVKIGRWATSVVVILGLCWIPIMPAVSKGGLYQYLQSVQGYLAPPVTAVFLLGLFFKRINANGACLGLVIGFILGMLKLTIQALVGFELIKNPHWLVAFGNFSFLYYSGVLLLISIIAIVVGSLTSAPPKEDKLRGLTFSTLTLEQRQETRASWNHWDLAGTGLVLALVLGVYLYFSFWI
ncbi:MAG: sodium:solute symporter [Verrucomicrobiota bacterium]